LSASTSAVASVEPVEGSDCGRRTTTWAPVPVERASFRAACRTNQIHRFEVYLLYADGQEVPLGTAPPETAASEGQIHRLGGQFNLGRPPIIQPGDEQLVAVAMNLDGVEFSRADSFRFKVELDGTVVKELPFRVHHAVRPTPVMG